MLSFLTTDWSLQTVAALNAVLAWSAACVHFWAASKTSGLLRKMFVAIASLATFYSVAYWWLVFNVERGAEWSDFLRPFGIFTWIVAWSIEPIVLVTYLSRRGDEIVKKAQKVAEKVEKKLDE